MFPRHLNLREKQNIFLINNNGMPKEKANSAQHHEKTMWALSELEISFKNQEVVGWMGRYTANHQAGCFLDLWLQCLAESGLLPHCGEQTQGPRPSIYSTSVGSGAALLYVGALGMRR